ncbi:Fe-S cluster assembly protein SufB [symbiont of Argiope bruennichi]|uniref:Fe-S cluster assembly protein SufB n=1 Tax=symbiont of Argiope bruennichi TaxID=2810479 RepID=UPI003DA3B28A
MSPKNYEILKEIKDSKKKFDFVNKEKNFFSLNFGISEEKIIQISKIKQEPEWMLNLRKQSFKKFLSQEEPWWATSIKNNDFKNYKYFVKATEKVVDKWTKVPKSIKSTFNKLGILEAEQKWLSGVSTQYESEVVYHKLLKEVEDKGVIFLDTDTALKKHPEYFKEFFGKVINFHDNKYAALNTSVWSGGSFIYVPKNVKLDKPLQSYFRMNTRSFGQFERTLIIADENSSVHYIEGCTAPFYTKNSLHSAVVEIIVKKNAKVKYTTIQNWSKNVFNLVTKRALVEEGGKMEWIDGNIGSMVTMKYPSCILKGDNSFGRTISIAFADSKKITQDTGSKMIHLGKNTKSEIISKTIAINGGTSIYRGMVFIDKNALNSYSNVVCDTLLLDNKSKSKTLPWNQVLNNSSYLEHEASISKIKEEEINYFKSRGIPREKAVQMIVMGFISNFQESLPMEYAVELNQLLKILIT